MDDAEKKDGEQQCGQRGQQREQRRGQRREQQREQEREPQRRQRRCEPQRRQRRGQERKQWREQQCEQQCGQQREPQRRQRRAAIAVCALLLVVLVAGISLWSPWSAGQDQDQDGSDAAQGSASEIQDVADAEREQSETGDEEDQSETGDSGTQAEDEEWPGQSLGYIGPNGEGALKDYDYDTIEEYTSLITDVFNGGWENYVERSYASDSDGEYVVGFLTVWFTCGEYDAHEIAEKHGAVWVSDYYMFMDGANDSVMVTLYFPDAQDRGDLKEIVEAITAEDGVKGANLLDDFGKLTPDG